MLTIPQYPQPEIHNTGLSVTSLAYANISK